MIIINTKPGDGIMKNGLIFENDELIFYRNDIPYHAGVVQEGDATYYIGSDGRAVKGQRVIHTEFANELLPHGTYTFGDDYKLIPGSYIPPQRIRRKRRFRRHKTTALVILLSSLLLIVSLFFVEYNYHVFSQPNTETPVTTSPVVSLPKFDNDVLLCSPTAKSEYNGQLSLYTATQAGDPYRSFVFTYQLTGNDGTLLLSENAAFAKAQSFALPQAQNSISIDNLKTNTTYYYRVIVNGQEFPGSFKTAESTRFVSIPGLVNTRDIGGYTTQGGKLVKQGLLIRGVELDGLVNASYFIPNADLESVKQTFGFVYEMDLRAPSVYTGTYSSRLGIPHKFYNAPMYGAIFDSTFKDSLHQIFSDLADPQKYPMYMHCTWGTDRTGIVVFLLQGILNLSEKDMLREYELTGYANPEIVGNGNMNVIISGLEPYTGGTLQEKIVTYLTTVIGITDEEIASIRNIFLEE